MKNGDWDQVLREAELFDMIKRLVLASMKEMSEKKTTPQEASGGQPGAALLRAGILPEIKIVEERVVCSHRFIDLSGRPRMLRLFKAFCQAPAHRLKLDQILELVYEVNPTSSERFIESQEACAVKLLSRARGLSNFHFTRHLGKGIQWFVFDQDEKLWCLFRLRNEYISQKFVEKQMKSSEEPDQTPEDPGAV